MNYEVFVRDFAKRTQENLELLKQIQKEKPNYKVYEVTQLINSLLGLLIFPKESFYLKIPKTSLETLRKEGWPIPQSSKPDLEAKNLKDLLRRMRNATAHCLVEAVDSKHDETISGLRLWSGRNGSTRWEIVFTTEELEIFTQKFIALIDNQLGWSV